MSKKERGVSPDNTPGKAAPARAPQRSARSRVELRPEIKGIIEGLARDMVQRELRELVVAPIQQRLIELHHRIQNKRINQRDILQQVDQITLEAEAYNPALGYKLSEIKALVETTFKGRSEERERQRGFLLQEIHNAKDMCVTVKPR
jgi:DNA primase